MAILDLQQRRSLGNSGVSVPVIGFGSSGLGNMPDTYGYSVDEERAYQTIRAVFDSPFGFLDTARNYGMGRSEQRIGNVVREAGGLPDGFVLSTKLDRDIQSGRFNSARARRSLEQSLTTLGLDKVQLLHLHDPEHVLDLDDVIRPDGALAELFRMKEEGLAQAVGLAAGRVDIMMPILRDWDFDALITHNRYTLTNRNAEAMIDLALSRGVAVLNAAPYAGGALAKGSTEHPMYVYQKASEEMLQPIRHVEVVCKQYDIPLGAAALQFSLRDSRIASTICGVTKPERVAQTIAWAGQIIPDPVWEALGKLNYSIEDPEATRAYKPE